jgi:hypothetical protein
VLIFFDSLKCWFGSTLPPRTDTTVKRRDDHNLAATLTFIFRPGYSSDGFSKLKGDHQGSKSVKSVNRIVKTLCKCPWG